MDNLQPPAIGERSETPSRSCFPPSRYVWKEGPNNSFYIEGGDFYIARHRLNGGWLVIDGFTADDCSPCWSDFVALGDAVRCAEDLQKLYDAGELAS